MFGLDFERLVLAGGPVGILIACYDLALSYSKERRQFNQRICDFQLIQGKLSDMYSNLSASLSYLLHVAKLADMGKLTREQAASVILFVSEKATFSAMETIQILGGNGYSTSYPAERFLRDAKLFEIGAGTNEIRRILIARELTR